MRWKKRIGRDSKCVRKVLSRICLVGLVMGRSSIELLQKQYKI